MADGARSENPPPYAASGGAGFPTPLPGPVAYLTGQYPRATDTFIQREVAALRASGAVILTCSVRRTETHEHVGPRQTAEAAETYVVQSEALRPRTLLTRHAKALARAPLRYLGALGLALRTAGSGARALLYQLFYFAEAGVLAERLRRDGAVHLHNHFGDSSCSVAMLAAAIGGFPFSFTLHGPADLFEPVRWRLDAKIARARFVVCISRFTRSQAMLFSEREHWKKLHIVHCGVDPALYRGEPRPPDAPPTLLFVGRLAAIKGLDVLLEAIAALRARRPQLRLTLVGDGPERARIAARADALGLGDATRFLGYRSEAEVARELAEADIFVLPSFAEGVPVVLMEAMATRRPVVVSNVGGVTELVRDGVSGFVIPPGDPDALAERIEQLLTDLALRARMGEAGRTIVTAEFDAAREAARLRALFAAYGAGRPAPGIRPDPASSGALRSGEVA